MRTLFRVRLAVLVFVDDTVRRVAVLVVRLAVLLERPLVEFEGCTDCLLLAEDADTFDWLS